MKLLLMEKCFDFHIGSTDILLSVGFCSSSVLAIVKCTFSDHQFVHIGITEIVYEKRNDSLDLIQFHVSI